MARGKLGIPFLLSLMTMITPLSAEEALTGLEPEEPELELPEMELTIEGESADELEALLPDMEEPEVPGVYLPLPPYQGPEDPGFTETPDTLLPDWEIPGGDGEGEPTRSLFSETLLSLGSRGSLTGEVQLYGISDAPGYELRFRYDSREGAGTLDSRDGAFQRRYDFSGSLSWLDSDYNLEFDAALQGRELGLQGLAPAYSSSFQLAEGSFSGAYTALSPFEIRLEGRGAWGFLDLTAGGAFVPQREALVSGGGALAWVSDPMVIELKGIGTALFSGTETGGAWTTEGGGDLFCALNLSDAWDLSLTAGIRGADSGAFWFPWQLLARFHLWESWQLELSGGYGGGSLWRLPLWEQYGFVSGADAAGVPDSLPRDEGWRVSGALILIPSYSLTATFGGEYRYSRAALQPAGINGSGLSSLLTGPLNTLFLSAALEWAPAGSLLLSAAWTGQFGSAPDLWRPLHEIAAGAEAGTDDDRWGFESGLRWDLFGADHPVRASEPWPTISLSASWAEWEPLILVLSLDDPFSLLIPGGRRIWGSYREQGFEIALTAEISL